MQSVFFALLHRLRTTPRWSGMMALQAEDVAQHSYGVAVIAHALCVIDTELYGKTPPIADVMAAALLHDASESILTDVIAPVKKYSTAIETAFAQLEQLAEAQLLETLPASLRSAYEGWFVRSQEGVRDYIKAADKLDALCKCKQEIRRGNQDFAIAETQIQEALKPYAERMPSVQYFMNTFMPAFERSIDEYRYLQ